MGRLQEMLKSKMTELAEQNRMSLDALGEELSNKLVDKLMTNEEEIENVVEEFKKAIQSKGVVL